MRVNRKLNERLDKNVSARTAQYYAHELGAPHYESLSVNCSCSQLVNSQQKNSGLIQLGHKLLNELN